MEARDALRTATTVLGRAATLKLSAVAAVALVLLLLVVGLLGAGSLTPAAADSCGGRGTPATDLSDLGDDAKAPAAGTLREQQVTNAKTIDTAARSGGLSGRATLIALMTALQESTLLNLDHGHLDSVGMFQQRPSQGWGSRDQIMRPAYAARMFLFGAEDGDPRGLTDIPQWESKSTGALILDVQRPDASTIDLYLGQEDAARQIAELAGTDLDRTGTTGPVAGLPGAPPDDRATTPGSRAECYPDSTPGDGAAGDPFYDGAADWPAVVRNPRSTRDAIAWARREALTGGPTWYRWCLRFAAAAYGRSSAGSPLAIGHYRSMPPQMRHPGDRNPPPGALMYWDTGGAAGHVALYLGDGQIASNDILRPGYIDVVDATAIESRWGATYLGWTPPYFPHGG